MGVDVGAVRIGVALSEGSLALAHDTLPASATSQADLAELAAEKAVETIFVGLPLSLSGGPHQKLRTRNRVRKTVSP